MHAREHSLCIRNISWYLLTSAGILFSLFYLNGNIYRGTSVGVRPISMWHFRLYPLSSFSFTFQFVGLCLRCEHYYVLGWSVRPSVRYYNWCSFQINTSDTPHSIKCRLKVIYHLLYGMNKYVLIWGDWLSCDPLRGSHDSRSPHIWRWLVIMWPSQRVTW